MKSKFWEDDNGNLSSIRLILLILLVVFVYLMFLFTKMIYHELNSKDPINYQGLAIVFSSFFIQFILVILSKVIQKRFENKNKNER